MDDQTERLRLIARFPRLDRLITRYLRSDQGFTEESSDREATSQRDLDQKYGQKYYDD